MKTIRYTLAVGFLIAASLIFSTDILAQRGGSRYGRGHSYSHNRGYSNGYNRGYSGGYNRYSYGPRYYSQRSYYYNRPYVSIGYGGINYRYQSGYYYRPYGASFQFSIPPFGLRISTLPLGYRSFYVGPSPYYYYGGTYYRPYANNQYEVIAPPLGAVVGELPPGAKVTVIDGKKYYELNGTYYEETITNNSDLEYTVVGTDGVLNTDTADDDNNNNSNNTNRATGPAVGDRFDDLPAESKSVVVNGQKLYLSPSGFYYKEVIDGSKVTYEIVGK